MISIDTKRLHLRNVLQNDVDVIFDYRNNEICARYQRGQVKDYDGIVSLIERRRNDEISIDFPCMIAVALKDTNEMIGEIVVMPKDHTFSLGYTFSYKYHRQGYAFEVLTVLHEHLHKMAPEWEFISFTECENISGIELLKKLGYKDLGYVSCFRYYRKCSCFSFAYRIKYIGRNLFFVIYKSPKVKKR